MKEENERLKENNDIQNRLWKVWLQEHDIGKNRENRNNRIEEQDKEVEVIVEENEVRNKVVEKGREKGENQTTGGFKDRNERREQVKRYCHFWNNGRCKYRDSECWFMHKESPNCKFGRECRMRRCMFYHPHRENRYMNEEEQNRNNMREGQEHQSNYHGESCLSTGSSPHREKRWSGVSMKQSNSKIGNPWNCLRGMSR